MAIQPSDISDDAALGARVLAYARPVAPCIQTLEGMPAEEAIAILRSVAVRVKPATLAGVKAVGDWTFFSDAELGSLFTPDDRAGLRALCGQTPTSDTGPVGSFPSPVDYSRIFP